MARSANQKLKLLYLAKLFQEETDEEHALSLAQIADRLEAQGIHADRKTLYQDFEELRYFGLDVVSEQRGRTYYYYLGERDFELPELKLLVDSVQSAKFISDRKSGELIRKLEHLASVHQARQLQRQVVISGRVKSMNESIYYNVDRLHEAINRNVQIRFQYFQWNVKKEPVLRRGGEKYQVSPWGLMWDDENYYLVAYDAKDGIIKHYRVDKMLKIDVTKVAREGQEAFRKVHLPGYSKSLFGMFGGEDRRVTLEADNAMAGVMIDRFGKEVRMLPVDEEHFRVSVDVAVSPQFFGWLSALGPRVRLTGPEEVVRRMREQVRALNELYGSGDGGPAEEEGGDAL